MAGSARFDWSRRSPDPTARGPRRFAAACVAALFAWPSAAFAQQASGDGQLGAGAAPDDGPLPPLPPPPPPPFDPPAPPDSPAPATPLRPPLAVLRATAPATHWPREPSTRRFEGFYLRTSIGVAAMAAWGRGPSGSAAISGDGPALGAAVGGSVRPGLAVAANARFTDTTGVFRGSAPGSSADALLLELGVLVDWYPDPNEGWHIGGEIGVGGVSVTPSTSENAMTSATLGGALVGGYDWRIHESFWAFGVMVVASGALPATLADAHGDDSGYRMQGFAVSVEGTALFF